MSSKASVEKIQAERISRPWLQRGCGRHGSSGHLFGLDAERMSPKAQTFAALAVLAPVALSGVFLVAFVPGLWWIFTTYFWLAFPAFGLLARGDHGLLRTAGGDSLCPLRRRARATRSTAASR